MNTCKECRYWESEEIRPDVGWCHRYPPMRAENTFPIMKEDEWCGEFKLKHELELCPMCCKPLGKDAKFQMGNLIPIGYVCAKCYREPEPKP